MATEQEMTYEQLVKLAEEANQMTASQPAFAAAADPGQIIARLCELWKKIRPIYMAVIKFPFIPPVVRQALQTLADLLDRVCGLAGG